MTNRPAVAMDGSPARSHGVWGAVTFLVALTILYAPSLLRAYDYHDAFYLYAYSDHDNCASHPQYAYAFATGRPLYALINCHGVARLIHRVEDTWRVRSIAVLLLAISAACLERCFRRIGWTDRLAWLLTLSLLVVPGMQVFVNGTQGTPIIYAFPLVIGSALALAAGVAAWFEQHAVRAAGRVLLSLLLILGATLIYQQTTPALFVLVFVLAWSLPYARRREARALFGVSIAVYALNGGLYLALYHRYILPAFATLSGQAVSTMTGDTREIALSIDAAGKLSLLRELTWRASSLWFVGGSWAVAFLVLVVASLLILTRAWADRRALRLEQKNVRVATSYAAERVGYVAMSVVLVNAANLIAKSDSRFYRVFIPYQWLIIVVLVMFSRSLMKQFGTPRAQRRIAVVLGALLVFGCGAAAWNLNRYMAAPERAEYSYVRDRLAVFAQQPAPPICVVQPASKTLFDGFDPEQDEFGRLTSTYTQDVPWLLEGAAHGMNSLRGLLTNPRILAASDTKGRSTCDFVIDMDAFARAYRAGLAD